MPAHSRESVVTHSPPDIFQSRGSGGLHPTARREFTRTGTKVTLSVRLILSYCAYMTFGVGTWNWPL